VAYFRMNGKCQYLIVKEIKRKQIDRDMIWWNGHNIVVLQSRIIILLILLTFGYSVKVVSRSSNGYTSTW
jgi:hypothetical protein